MSLWRARKPVTRNVCTQCYNFIIYGEGIIYVHSYFTDDKNKDDIKQILSEKPFLIDQAVCNPQYIFISGCIHIELFRVRGVSHWIKVLLYLIYIYTYRIVQDRNTKKVSI